MKLLAQIKPNSKITKAEKLPDGSYVLRVQYPAKENHANIAAIELLAKTLNAPKTKIRLLKGAKSKYKTFEIID